MSYAFYVKNFADMQFASNRSIDHEEIAINFINKLRSELNDTKFEELLTVSGFIPDLYGEDSSEETLFSKLIECLVAEWARRMAFGGEIIKEKASREDVKITIGNNVVVCDAKSFRLGRSQAAPNAKDFLKLEDIRKWMARYHENAIGGLVTYPCKHEWSKHSDVYQYCSTCDAPTVMLPYKYLAFLLNKKSCFEPNKLRELWQNYGRLFPDKLPKKMQGGNKIPYWRVINAEILRIVGVTEDDLFTYMADADKKISECITENMQYLFEYRNAVINKISSSVSKVQDLATLREQFIEYRKNIETREITQTMDRISQFRR